MKKNAKSKRSDAERAAEHFAVEVHDCVRTIRAVRTQWQYQDLFGADIMGIRQDGTKVFIQVTAGQDSAVSSRRRKLEVVPWHSTDTVLLLQLRQTEDPANARRKLWFFRVHQLNHAGVMEWNTLDTAVPVKREWFKALKNTDGK